MQDDLLRRFPPLRYAEMERLEVWQKTAFRRWDRFFARSGHRMMTLQDRFERFAYGIGFEKLGRKAQKPAIAGSGDGLVEVASVIAWLIGDNPHIDRNRAITHFLRCVERGDFGWRLRPSLYPKDVHPDDYQWRVVEDLIDLFGWNDRSITEGNYQLRPALSTVRERPLTMWSRRSVFRRWVESWAEECSGGLRLPQELGQSELIDLIPTRAAELLLAASGTEAVDGPPSEAGGSSTDPPASAAVKTPAAAGAVGTASKPKKPKRAPTAAKMVEWYDNHLEKGKPDRTPYYFAELWCEDHPHPNKDQSRWARTVFKDPGRYRDRD